MKIRSGFISNSSSTSFIVLLSKIGEKTFKEFLEEYYSINRFINFDIFKESDRLELSNIIINNNWTSIEIEDSRILKDVFGSMFCNSGTTKNFEWFATYENHGL